MKFSLIFFILSLGLILTSCQENKNHAKSDQDEVTGDEIPRDIKVPSLMWDLIEEKLPADFVEQKKKNQNGNHEIIKKNVEEEAMLGGGSKLPVLFTPVDVHLIEKNKGVLTSEEVVIHMPRGGGQIDLSKYVTDQPGSFYVKFFWPEMKEDKDEKEMKAWFVSNARKRKIDNEIFGDGCKSFFDVSKKIYTEMKHDGIKVNTTRNRHLSVLGGHFVFGAARGGKMLLTQVSFTDSKNENLFCNTVQQVEKQ